MNILPLNRLFNSQLRVVCTLFFKTILSTLFPHLYVICIVCLVTSDKTASAQYIFFETRCCDRDKQFTLDRLLILLHTDVSGICMLICGQLSCGHLLMLLVVSCHACFQLWSEVPHKTLIDGLGGRNSSIINTRSTHIHIWGFDTPVQARLLHLLMRILCVLQSAY